MVHFVLSDAVYPYRVGGMEVFNYYLIRELSKNEKIYYSSSHCLPFNSCHHYHLFPLRPTKIFNPFQVFLFHLLHPSVKNVVFSYSAAHWLLWSLYSWIIRIFNLNAIAVIHYGWRPDDSNHPERIRRFFSACNHIFAVSEDIKKNYDSQFDVNCKIVYPLVPFLKSSLSQKEARLKYGIPNNRFVICMVGSLKGMKNPQTILESLLLLSQNDISEYNPHIVYAGDGPLREPLQIFAVHNNLSDRVSFLGNVPKENVSEIMALSDCYLIASDFEGTSVSVLEAMSNRMPIIYSNSPGLNNMLEDGLTGLAFTNKDATALMTVLLKLLQNEKYRFNLGENAYRQYVNKYNYKTILAAFVDAFK